MEIIKKDKDTYIREETIGLKTIWHSLTLTELIDLLIEKGVIKLEDF